MDFEPGYEPILKSKSRDSMSLSARERDARLLRFGITSQIKEYQPLVLHTSIPIIKPYDVDVQFVRSQSQLLDFNKLNSATSYDRIVSFYMNDYLFARLLNNPEKYISRLKLFRYVITPDFSQLLGMPEFQLFNQNCWNKAMAAYMQLNGVNIIYNVTWSIPDSYEYAFTGIPKGSPIAINCTGIKSSAVSMYLWRQGYQEALRIIRPRLILRYGDKLPGEREDISVYFANSNIARVRNGSERK